MFLPELNKSECKATRCCIHATAGVVYENLETLQMGFDESMLMIQKNDNTMLLLKVRVSRQTIYLFPFFISAITLQKIQIGQLVQYYITRRQRTCGQ